MGPGGGGIANTLVLFACIYFVGKIDFTDADNLFRLRVTYGIVQALTLAAFAYVYTRITAVADRTPVTLADGTRTTVEQYDLGKLKEVVRGSVMGTGISLFIHLKMGVVPPLFIQSVMAPIQTGQNPLVRLYVLGDRSAELTTRPWKEPPSPFAALMGGAQPEANAAPADGPAPDAAAAPAQANETSAEETSPNTTEEPAAESTEAAATEEKAETAAPEPAAAAPAPAKKDEKKPAAGKKGKKKAAEAATVAAAEVTATEAEAPAAEEAAPAATEAPAAATVPAVSTLSESQEEPASPASDSGKQASVRRRKPKAEQ